MKSYGVNPGCYLDIDINLLFLLSALSAAESTIDDKNVGIFAHPDLQHISLGNVTDAGLLDIFPRVLHELTESDMIEHKSEPCESSHSQKWLSQSEKIEEWEDIDLKCCGCWSLKSLALSDSEITLSRLVELINLMPDLDMIRFHNVRFPREEWAEVLKVLMRFENVLVIEFSYCTWLSLQFLNWNLLKDEGDLIEKTQKRKRIIIKGYLPNVAEKARKFIADNQINADFLFF
jgi:hypothetical protein